MPPAPPASCPRSAANGRAALLIGGDKTGDDRFYEAYILVADRLYDTYLEEIRQEGLLP
jgi:hypothetical protein